MGKLMRAIRNLLALTLVFVVSACGGNGARSSLAESQEASPWRFVRGGVEAHGATSSTAFTGRLDVLWERSLKEKPQAPITFSNGVIVIAGAKRKVFLINPDDGETITKFKNRSSPQSGGLLVDSLLYNSVSPPFNYLDCRGVANGKLRWRSVILDISAPLLSHAERLFALGGDGVAYCFNRFSGDLLWEKSIGGKMIAAPALEIRTGKEGVGAVLWIPNSNGWIGAYDAASGKELFLRKMGESLVSTPAVQANTAIYFSGQDGHAYSLVRHSDNAATAEILSELINPAEPSAKDSPDDSFVLAKFDLQSPSWSSPAISGEYVIFVDNTGHVYCFDSPQLTEPLWQTSLGGALVASPIIVGEFVVVGLLDGRLITIRLGSGEIAKTRQLESRIKYPPISDGDRIYVATQRKSLYCFGSLNR